MTTPATPAEAVAGPRLPRVTVAVPTRDGERWLAEAVDSALAQTFADREVLVLDNASADGTPALMEARYGGDPRVRYRRNPRDLGLAGNVRRAVELARGEYLLVLGADDRLEPRFLAEAVAFLDAEPRCALVHGPAYWMDADGRAFGGTADGAWPRLTPRGPPAMLAAFRAGFCFSTMLMRAGAIRATGPFDEGWREVVDLWLFLRLCLAGDVGHLPGPPLCGYRVHGGAMSMPMYRENAMFRRQAAAAREAFAWPEAVALGATGRDRRVAERAAARIALQVAHTARAGGGYGPWLRNLAEVAAAVPEAALWPGTWARVGFGLLPRPAMARLAALRRRRALARHGGDRKSVV